MSLLVEIDPELAVRPLADLKAMLAEETAKGEALKAEMQAIGGEIDRVVAINDEEAQVALHHRRNEIPIRLTSNQVRHAQIQMAIESVLLQEGEQAFAELGSERGAKQKLLTRAQEAFEKADNAWGDMNYEREERARRIRELSMRIRDLREMQAQLLHQATGFGGASRRTAA